ncbi:MAG: acyltransferase [Burkholderiales bacterium]|nr:acyltransferase [Burkholderiales bacterium]
MITPKSPGMHEYSFASLPPSVDLVGAFGDDCTLRLSGASLSALERGRLKLRIHRMGRSGAVDAVRLQIGAHSGQIGVWIGAPGATLDIGEGCSGLWDVRMWREASIRIEGQTTSNGTKVISDCSDVQVGEDCMFSSGIVLQAADQHGIVDLATGRIVNDQRRSLTIGRHVWLGRNATVLPDVHIGEGAIIGSATVVTHDVPPTCVAAGVPARVVRREVTWSRSPTELDAVSTLLVAEFASRTTTSGDPVGDSARQATP